MEDLFEEPKPEKPPKISRRNFLKAAAGIAVGGVLSPEIRLQETNAERVNLMMAFSSFFSNIKQKMEEMPKGVAKNCFEILKPLEDKLKAIKEKGGLAPIEDLRELKKNMTDFCRSVFKKETIVEVMLLKREQIIDRLAEHAIRRKIEERFSLDEEAFFESIFGKDIGVKMKSREQKLQEIDKRIEALKYLKDNHRQSLAIIRKKLEDFEFGDRTKDIEREMEYYFRNKISNWKNWKKAISAEG